MNTIRPVLKRPPARGPTATARPTPRQVASPSRASPARRGLVTTATLVRGRVYFYKGVPFDRGVEVGIVQELLDQHNVDSSVEQFLYELEDLYETVTDSDKEKWEKSIFELREGRPMPATTAEQREAERPRRIKQFVEVPRRDSRDAGVARRGLQRRV